MPALAAWTAFLLCKRVTGGAAWPSLAGGYLFGFSTYLLAAELTHIFSAAVFLLPVAALLVLRFVDGELGPRGFAFRFGLLLAAQMLLSTEVLFVAHARARRRPRPRADPRPGDASGDPAAAPPAGRRVPPRRGPHRTLPLLRRDGARVPRPDRRARLRRRPAQPRRPDDGEPRRLVDEDRRRALPGQRLRARHLPRAPAPPDRRLLRAGTDAARPADAGSRWRSSSPSSLRSGRG